MIDTAYDPKVEQLLSLIQSQNVSTGKGIELSEIVLSKWGYSLVPVFEQETLVYCEIIKKGFSYGAVLAGYEKFYYEI